MTRYHVGQNVLFKPHRGSPMQAVITKATAGVKQIEIRIAKDPFPVTVKKSQVSPCDKNGKPLESNEKANKGRDKEIKSKMTTDTKPSARELRNEAKALGVEDYDEMSRKELVAAIKAAKKGSGKTKAKSAKGKKVKTEKVSAAEAAAYAEERAAKKTKGKKGSAAKAAAKSKPAAKSAKPSSKAAKASKATKAPAKSKGGSSKAATNGSGDNPFRKGSNLHIICSLLLKGGKRETLAEKLSEKAELHPYSGNDVSLQDYDKRILLGAQTLRDKHGFKIERTGRGLEGKIKVVPGGKRKG